MAQDRLIFLLLNVDVHDKYTTAPPNPVSNDSAFCLLIHHFGNWHHGTGFSYPRDDELASEFLILLRAFFLKLDPRNCPNRSYVRCIIDSGPRQASVAESPVALPPFHWSRAMRYHTPSISAIECSAQVPDNTPVLICPSCGDTMQHLRTIPKLGARLEQFIFVCPANRSKLKEVKGGHKGA